MKEPYEQLDRALLERTVRAYRSWAAAQKNEHEPLVEKIGGSTITPRDLLVEAPPWERFRFSLERPLPGLALDMLRLRLRHGDARVWPHILNLVAIYAEYHGEDVVQMLDEIGRGDNAEAARAGYLDGGGGPHAPGRPRFAPLRRMG